MIVNEPEEFYKIDNLIFKEEVYEIVSCAMQVHRALGKGFLEVVYKDALSKEFKYRNIPFDREKKFDIIYRGEALSHSYNADFIVYGKIVLEIKAQNEISDSHYKQVINYLAVTGLKLGLLVNFGEDSLKFKRIVL